MEPQAPFPSGVDPRDVDIYAYGRIYRFCGPPYYAGSRYSEILKRKSKNVTMRRHCEGGMCRFIEIEAWVNIKRVQYFPLPPCPIEYFYVRIKSRAAKLIAQATKK